jgi:hypothetical protein
VLILRDHSRFFMHKSFSFVLGIYDITHIEKQCSSHKRKKTKGLDFANQGNEGL